MPTIDDIFSSIIITFFELVHPHRINRVEMATFIFSIFVVTRVNTSLRLTTHFNTLEYKNYIPQSLLFYSFPKSILKTTTTIQQTKTQEREPKKQSIYKYLIRIHRKSIKEFAAEQANGEKNRDMLSTTNTH
jgi:hypothetical protein